MFFHAIFLIIISLSSNAKESLGGQSAMNGYSMKSFSGFEKKWKFVTVRYRKDTKELRMVYANPIAWKALSSGSTNYPKGSVFGKIAFVTEEDPDFVSSEVPAGTRRFQFMVRDQKKFKDTDGWGYMLFDSNGKTFPEDPKVQSIACAACHKIVESSKGSVFSQVMDISPLKKHIKTNVKVNNKFSFETLTLDKFSKDVIKFLPPATKELRSMVSSLKTNLFQGTLDEIKPELIKEALRSKLPTILYSETSNRFSLIYFNQDSSACLGATQHALVAITTQEAPKAPLIQPFCSE
jgi:hypothetical protein